MITASVENFALTPAKRLTVLVSAYACEPNKGGEPGVGWTMSCGIARHHDVWVLTRANNRRVIEAELARCPIPNLHFIYHDLPTWARFWKRGRGGIQLYSYLWQVTAVRVVLAAHQREHFDIAHHITFVRYWVPTCLYKLPIPFIWGPLGGGEDAPLPFWPGLGITGIFFELTRILARWIAGFDPLIRAAAKRCALAIATAKGTRLRLEKLGPRRIEMMSEVAFPEWQAEFQYLLQLAASTNSNFRLISIGNLIPLKGYHLGLKAFARAGIENSEYWIIGDGWQRKRLEHLARRLGVAERVRFFGARSRHEVLKLLAQCDALVHPSLHDSGGWACLEAMSAGRPVLCLNLGGPATQVTREVGFCCSASFPAVAINALAAAMVRLASEPALCETLGQAGRRRIHEHYLLETRIQYFLDCYRRALTQ